MSLALLQDNRFGAMHAPNIMPHARRAAGRALPWLAAGSLLLASQAAWPQDDAMVRLLLSTAWCQESATELSLHTVRLTFLPDGSLRFRKEVDLSNGSHNATNHRATWVVRNATLVIAEPNGGESRLPIVVQGSGRATQLNLGNARYTVCR